MLCIIFAFTAMVLSLECANLIHWATRRTLSSINSQKFLFIDLAWPCLRNWSAKHKAKVAVAAVLLCIILVLIQFLLLILIFVLIQFCHVHWLFVQGNKAFYRTVYTNHLPVKLSQEKHYSDTVHQLFHHSQFKCKYK